MKIRKIGLILFSSIMLLSVVCSSVSSDVNNKITISEAKHETKEIDLNEAERVKTEINIGVGKLNVSGDSDKLMKAEFIYNVPNWKPNVNYSVNGKVGKLLLQQPTGTKSNDSNVQNDWNISLNNNIPMDLKVILGVGNSILDLNKLNIKDLNVEMGVGEMDLNLCGNYKNSVTANIEGGVGNATIYLPKNIGVCVEAQNGVGKINSNGFSINGNKYTNEAYGKSQVSINLKVASGVGNIKLELK